MTKNMQRQLQDKSETVETPPRGLPTWDGTRCSRFPRSPFDNFSEPRKRRSKRKPPEQGSKPCQLRKKKTKKELKLEKYIIKLYKPFKKDVYPFFCEGHFLLYRNSTRRSNREEILQKSSNFKNLQRWFDVRCITLGFQKPLFLRSLTEQPLFS